MAKYRVEMPFKCVQVFYVEANSAAEAKRLARQGQEEGGPVEAIDWHVVRHFAPNFARLIEDSQAVGNDQPGVPA